MYFERQTLKGMGATQEQVLVGTGLLSTLFPSYADTIQKTVTAVYGEQKPAATKTAAAAQSGASQPFGLTTEKVMMYGGIGLAALAVVMILTRR